MIYWESLLGGYIVGAVSSQSLMDLFMVLMIIGWSAYAIKDKSLSLNWIGVEWAFLAYFLVACCGFIFNATNDAPWTQALSKFVWFFHLYILIFAFRQVRFNRQYLVQYLSVAFLFPSLYSFTGYINGYDPITQRENSRVMGLVNSATYHAHGNALIFVFFAAIMLFAWKSFSIKWRCIAFTCLGLMGLSILLTFTRGIWLSIFFSTLLMLFLYDARKVLAVVIATGVFVGGAYFSWPQFRERIHHSTSTSENSERLNLFKVNVQIWEEYPLLGIGYGENLRRNREYWDRPEWHMPKDYITSHAHNQFLNVMATTGILGLIPFVWIFAFFVRKNWRLLRKTSHEETPLRYAVVFGCLWAQIEFILGCLSDVSFEYAKIRALILVIWALVVAIDLKPEIVTED